MCETGGQGRVDPAEGHVDVAAQEGGRRSGQIATVAQLQSQFLGPSGDLEQRPCRRVEMAPHIDAQGAFLAGDRCHRVVGGGQCPPGRIEKPASVLGEIHSVAEAFEQLRTEQ